MNYKLIFFNIFRKKRLFKFSSVAFCIVIIGYVFLSSLENGTKKLYESKQIEYIANLFLNISSDKNYYDTKADIADINSIIEIYPLAEITIDEYSLIYHDDRLVSILEGREINNSNELLISNYNDKYKIGDVLKIKGKNFTIVGIYDFSEYQFANSENISSDSFYCSYEFYVDNIKFNEVYNAMIRIDSYDNLEYTIEHLTEYTIGSYSKNIDVLERFLNLQQNVKTLTQIFTVFLLLITTIVMYVIIHDNNIDFAIFKSFGYSSLLLSKVLLIQSLLLLLINFIISIAVICLIFLILELLNINILIFNINNIINCFLLFVIGIFINLIVYFAIIKKINIIKVLKSI